MVRSADEQAVPPIPVSVITGFLGSGKTTLLNALLRDPRMADTAVVVNEFGEIGLDHLLVESAEEDVVLLGAGCLCCTIRDDLVACLTSLHERRRTGAVPAFSRLVLETSGLADPAPVLHTLLSHESLRDHYVVDGIVTTVDAVNAPRQLAEHEEPLKQIAVADRVVLTKADLLDERDDESLRVRIADINPGAPLIAAVHGDVDPAALTDVGLFSTVGKNADVSRWLEEEAHRRDGHHHAAPHRGDGVRTFSLVCETPLPIHRFVAWVESLLVAHGDRLLRLKGMLNAIGSEGPIVVHGVQHVFHPLQRLERWPDADRRSRVVIIARDLDRADVEPGFLAIAE